VGGRLGDLGTCVNGKEAPQERAITDPSLSVWQTDGDSRLPNVAYCTDRNCAGYDFEPEPEAGHDFEIFNWKFTSASIQSVSHY